MMTKKWIVGLLVVAAVVSAGAYVASNIIFADIPRVNVLKTDGADRVVLMDFREPISLDPVPEGWHHRIFRSHSPMSISFVEKNDRPSIRLETNDSASILTRMVDVPLDDYASLRWAWFIETPISSDLDERTGDGDDHPARLYLKFRAVDGKTHKMEIIWGNQRIKKDEWLIITELFLFDFPHYAANAGMDNIGRWHDESVDLRALFQKIGGDPTGARLTEIGLFADSDQTDSKSIAYFSDVAVAKQ